jgi:cytosine/adenosine deaminase-related metal-dependent hydrolase
MATTTVFRRAAWVVAWDDARASHVYRRDIDVAIQNAEIVFLGKDFAGTADMEVDCARRLVLPGLVNIHTHPTTEPLRKGITDETRSPGFWHSSLYEFLTVFNNDRDGSIAAMQVALAELLMSGVTTVVVCRLPSTGGSIRSPSLASVRSPHQCFAMRDGLRRTATSSTMPGIRRLGARALIAPDGSSTSPTNTPPGG